MLGRITQVAIAVVHRYTLAEGLLDVGFSVIQSRKKEVMSEVKLPITPEISFNGITYTHMTLTDSAQQHYGAMSVTIYNYITQTLHGQSRSHDEVNRSGEKIYHLASSINTADVPAISKYRDTCFKLDGAHQEIIYFHGSPRGKKKYEDFPEKFKERIESM